MKERRFFDEDEQSVAEKSSIRELEKKNAELYKDLFIEAIDGIVFWNDEGVIDANESACKIFESSIEDLKGRRIFEFVIDHDGRYDKVVKTLRTEGSVRDELLYIMPNGQKKYLEFTSKLNAVDGNHMTIFRNVTERYEMEQQLRERENKFRNVFEGALEGFILWRDDNEEIVDVNPSAAKMLDVIKEDLVGQSFFSALENLGVTKEKADEYLDTFKRAGQSEGAISFSLKSGVKKHFEFSMKHNVFSDLNLITFKDITEKLQLEEELRKSDTLNVIGELAAGIAHEIRNPMTALKGFIQLLEPTIKDKHSLYYDVIINELNRIDSIINEFLILAKPQAVQYSERDIVQIMRETVDLLGAQAVLHNIQICMDYEYNIPNLFCEPNQLKKVFINLIKNAIEVMPEGGKITISINQLKGEKIHISIKDEGFGMTPEKLQKLGEPFYTTKEKGTGLGLMVSFRIIAEHQGVIEVESEEGLGTIFHIYLPLQQGGKD